VGYHLPDVEECILAGDVPLPALEDLPKSPQREDVVQALETKGEMRALMMENLAFTYRLVGAMLDDINGESVEGDRVEVAKAFSPDQRERLFKIANRKEPKPPAAR
jgi:hypothetical protein